MLRQASEAVPFLGFVKGVAMPATTILLEAQQLKNVSQRLETAAEEHPTVTEALLTICGTIRSTATLLEVLVATKLGGSRPV